MRPSDPPTREERLLAMFGQPVDLDGIELAQTDERVETDLRCLDHIVGLHLDDLVRFTN